MHKCVPRYQLQRVYLYRFHLDIPWPTGQDPCTLRRCLLEAEVNHSSAGNDEVRIEIVGQLTSVTHSKRDVPVSQLHTPQFAEFR